MSTESGVDSDVALAHQLADAARVVSLSHFRRELRRWSKSDGSLATEADVAVEDELRAKLGIERPDDAVLGEERGQTGSGGRRWIIDGIDGTVDFAAGSSDWARSSPSKSMVELFWVSVTSLLTNADTGLSREVERSARMRPSRLSKN